MIRAVVHQIFIIENPNRRQKANLIHIERAANDTGIKIILLLLVLFHHNAVAQGKSSTETTGDFLQVLIPATAYATTFIVGDEEGRIQFYKSFLTNFIITHSLKRIVNKPRQDNNGNYAFPSGHTSAAFQGAAFIHKRYGIRYGFVAYVGAALVGLSRIEGESDKHDIVDVTAGATIGVLSSFYFTTPYKNVMITPSIESNSVSVNLMINW